MMREYHIHVNGLAMTASAAASLSGCGYQSRPFVLSVEGTCYTPAIHYSFKTNSHSEFEHTFRSAERILGKDGAFVGYVEGEYVSRRSEVEPGRGANHSPEPRLRLALQPAKRWREAEVHLVVREGAKIASTASDGNFYRSRIEKGGNLFDVCTAQGEAQTIAHLYDALGQFGEMLSDAHLSLKEEVLLRLFMSEGFNWLPPQVASFCFVRGG